MTKPLECACVVVPMPTFGSFAVSDSKILVVETTKHGPTTVGLPGGKLEPGESFLDGARRELREETGVHSLHLERLWTERYMSVHRPGQEIITQTFLCTEVDTRKLNLDKVYQNLKTPEGLARPGTWEELISPGGTSPYFAYNRNVMMMFHQWLFSHPKPGNSKRTSLIYKHFRYNPLTG